MYILNTLRSFCWEEEVKTGLKRLPNGIAFHPQSKKMQAVVKYGSRGDLG